MISLVLAKQLHQFCARILGRIGRTTCSYSVIGWLPILFVFRTVEKYDTFTNMFPDNKCR